jgi:Protein of unknown function (DUF3592)
MAPFLPHLSRLLQQTRIPAHPRIAAGTAAAAATAACIAWLYMRSRRPSAIELERRRREHLTLHGRISDGSIVDARSHDGTESISPTPDLLLFRYRTAGVTYDCAQDVSLLPECTAGYRIDQPVQVRYDPRNPGNSIIVSENWSGLRMKPQRELPFH